MILLGIWLIVTGLQHFIRLSFEGIGLVMALLALIAGILIILGR